MTISATCAPRRAVLALSAAATCCIARASLIENLQGNRSRKCAEELENGENDCARSRLIAVVYGSPLRYSSIYCRLQIRVPSGRLQIGMNASYRSTERWWSQSL